jgi:hypothetical protein
MILVKEMYVSSVFSIAVAGSAMWDDMVYWAGDIF